MKKEIEIFPEIFLNKFVNICTKSHGVLIRKFMDGTKLKTGFERSSRRREKWQI